MRSSSNRYLEGPFTPVNEEVTAFDLPVSGRLPAELNGRYLRNGPNPLGIEDPETYQGLVGAGMVHGVRLRDGKAEWYRNRWVRAKQLATALGEEPPPGPVFDKNLDFSVNTHVIGHAGKTLALVESGALPVELTYALDTVGSCDFGGTLPGGYAAHTKRDPATGELHAVAYYWGWDYVQHLVIDTTGSVVRADNIPVPDGPLMHDFSLTDRYVVLYDLPVTFDLELAKAASMWPYSWNQSRPARVGLLPRSEPAAEVRWLEVEPCWVFHTVNAYDDGEQVVVDVVRYPTMLRNGIFDGNGDPALERWTIDPRAGRVRQRRYDDRPQELPRVDERVVSKPHRYGYTTSVQHWLQTKSGEALLKHDYTTGKVETREFPAGSDIGEALFVPTSPDATEDDGYVMTLVNDPDRGATDLMILSAQDFTGDPIARVHLPRRVPVGLHGNWVADAT